MATMLTIDSTPSAINAVYDDVNGIKFSLTSADPNIVAVRGDLYVNGSYTTTIDGVQVLGTIDEFAFDVRKIMQSVLVSELRTNITTLAVTDATTSAAEIKMRFFEVVLTGGVYTHTWDEDGAGTNYLESSNYDVVNMARQPDEVLDDYVADASNKSLLTLRTDGCKIPRGVPFQLGFVSDLDGFAVYINALDLNLNSVSSSNSGSGVNVSYSKGVIEIPSSSFSSSNIKYLEVQLKTDDGFSQAVVSKTYRFKVVDYCDLFTIFIQNHLGDFEHYDFGAKVVKNITTKNQSIKKPLTSSYSSEDAGEIVTTSTTTERIKVQTGALSQVDLTYLQEFIKNHSVVYRWVSAGNFKRYVVKSHSTKVEDNDGVINSMSLTLEPSNNHIVQNGD